MNFKSNKHDKDIFYIKELGIDGTIPQLVQWANRYTDDYSDEALAKISELAKQCGYGELEVESPKLLIEERHRTEGLPYERMKLDLLIYDLVSFSQSEPDGTEIEIYRDRDNIVLSVQGYDENGLWNAANIFTIEEFKNGDSNWLQKVMGETLAYGTVYEEEEEYEQV